MKGFSRVGFILLRRASMNGFHVEGMHRDKRNIVFFTKICYLVPDEDALQGNYHIFREWFDYRGNVLGGSIHVLTYNYLTFGIYDTRIDGSNMEIDTTIMVTLLCLKFH